MICQPVVWLSELGVYSTILFYYSNFSPLRDFQQQWVCRQSLWSNTQCGWGNSTLWHFVCFLICWTALWGYSVGSLGFQSTDWSLDGKSNLSGISRASWLALGASRKSRWSSANAERRHGTGGWQSLTKSMPCLEMKPQLFCRHTIWVIQIFRHQNTLLEIVCSKCLSLLFLEHSMYHNKILKSAFPVLDRSVFGKGP